MHSCRVQQTGSGIEDLGRPIKLKRIYQSGGGRVKNYDYLEPDFIFPNRVMHGAGIGSLFIPLFRYLAPVVKPLLSKGLSALKQELVSAGTDILQNPTRDMVRKRTRQAVDNLKEKAEKKIKIMTGSGVSRRREKRKSIKTSKIKKLKHSKTSRRRVQSKRRNNNNKLKKNLQNIKHKILIRGQRNNKHKNIKNVQDIFQ